MGIRQLLGWIYRFWFPFEQVEDGEGCIDSATDGSVMSGKSLNHSALFLGQFIINEGKYIWINFVVDNAL